MIGRSAHLGILDKEISENQVSVPVHTDGVVSKILRALFMHDETFVVSSSSLPSRPLNFPNFAKLTLSSRLSQNLSEQLECKLTFSPVIAVELKVRVIDCLSNLHVRVVSCIYVLRAEKLASFTFAKKYTG